jgi:hypothetical protein
MKLMGRVWKTWSMHCRTSHLSNVGVPAMSKRHFIALADYAREVGLTEGQISILADLLQSENPRFNKSRWLNYISGNCGPSGGKVKK